MKNLSQITVLDYLLILRVKLTLHGIDDSKTSGDSSTCRFHKLLRFYLAILEGQVNAVWFTLSKL